MKRIIILSLVVLVFGICSNAGAWPSYTSNPSYNPRGGASGGGSADDPPMNGFVTSVSGSVWDSVVPNSVVLTSFLIHSIGDSTPYSDYTYTGFFYSSPAVDPPVYLSLPLSSIPGLFLVYRDGNIIAVARVTWVGPTLETAGKYNKLNRWDWTVEFILPGGSSVEIGFYNKADVTMELTIGPMIGTIQQTLYAPGLDPAPWILTLLTIIENPDLSQEVRNSYAANLKKVAPFIEDGKIIPAVNQLKAFIGKATQDLRKGKIGAGTVGAVEDSIGLANDIVNLLKL
jgi:hypothetical protein